MARQVSYPGVYIDEFAPAAPIQGVGTNVAAFLGPCGDGEPNNPTRVTSFDRFKALFGDQPLQGFFQWHAVKAFFECGGSDCYIVRVSQGTYSQLGYETPPTPSTALTDNAGNPMIRVRARVLGPQNPQIQVRVFRKNLISTAFLYQVANTTKISAALGRSVSVTTGHGVQFRAGDSITLTNAANQSEQVQILQVSGDALRIANNLGNVYAANDSIRLSDPSVGTTVVRIVFQPVITPPSGVLVPGAMLTINSGPNQDAQILDTVQTERFTFNNAPITTYRVTFREGLHRSFNIALPNVPVQSEEFDFLVIQGAATKTYSNLSIDPQYPNYFLQVVNSDGNGLVSIDRVEPPPPSLPPDNMPGAQGPTALNQGAQENLPGLVDNDYQNAIDSLRQITDINLIAIPDASARPAVQQGLITHCEQTADRFAVLDAAPNLELFGAAGVEGQRQGLDSTRGYAALYYPWLRVPPVSGGDPIVVPPSGHVCGIIARSDDLRGVHKAPANEIVDGSLGVDRLMSDDDQGILNLQGINVIRVFRNGARPMLWGARTTATDTNWQYVNIRRLFLFLEKSIQEGIRWAVFEPNNTGLWEKLRRSITDFLTRVWREGALFGETADKAFYVRIDDVLNPPATQALGRLYIEIGVRPSYPAEFIIVRIGIWYGGTQVTES